MGRLGTAQPYLSRRAPAVWLGGVSVPCFSGSPFLRPTLSGAGGWAWGARDRPDLWDPGLWLSGEPVTRGSRLFRGWDTCGRRELVSLQAHKYCSTSVAERTVRAARAPLRVSWCTLPDCAPDAPPPVRWTVSPDPLHPPRSGGQVDRTSESARMLGRKRGSGTCRFRAGEAAGVRMEPGRSGS